MINVRTLEINASYVCNLKCKQCANICWLGNKVATTAEVAKTVKAWSSRIRANHISVCGGEPLMNPDLLNILIEIRRGWSEFILVKTNGCFLNKLTEAEIEWMLKNNAKLWLAFKDTATYEANQDLLSQLPPKLFHTVKYPGHTNYKWYEAQQMEDGKLIQTNNNPQTAYEVCHAKKCVVIHDEKIYMCPKMFWLDYLKDQSYRLYPAIPGSHRTVQHSDEQLQQYLSKPSANCMICPEQLDWQPVVGDIPQLTPHELAKLSNAAYRQPSPQF